eukprot:s3204_g6.t1
MILKEPHGACHLIVEQAKPANRAAGHLTTLFEGSKGNAVSMQALSLPRFACISDIIDAASLQPQCEHRRCTARSGPLQFNVAVAVEVTTGMGIRFKVDAPFNQLPMQPGRPSSPQFTDDLDDPFGDRLVFMQLSLLAQTSAQPSECAAPPSAIFTCKLDADPVEPELVPAQVTYEDIQIAMPPIGDQPQLIQDIHSRWNPIATLGPGRMERRACIVVWFLDSLRMPECRIARAAILRVWQDFLRPDLDLNAYLVTPDPVGDRDGTVAKPWKSYSLAWKS